MADTETRREAKAPPYVPFETLVNFIATLNSTAPPSHIDRGLMHNMSGATQSHLLSALRFLGLVEPPDDSVTDNFRTLISSYGTDDWKSAFGAMLKSGYDALAGEVDISNTTDRRLRDAFQKVYSLEDSMVDRSVRFYIKGMNEAGMSVSPHVGRRRRSGGPRRTGQTRKNRTEGNGSTERIENHDTPLTPLRDPAPGMIDFPIPMGDKQGFIRVRADINMDQYPLVEAMLQAVKVLAQTNSKEKS